MTVLQHITEKNLMGEQKLYRKLDSTKNSRGEKTTYKIHTNFTLQLTHPKVRSTCDAIICQMLLN